MRTFESLATLSAAAFKRLTGVSRTTFNVMVDVVAPVVTLRQKSGGPRFRLRTEDMILVALMSWREYRTFFHIGLDCGMSESQAFRTVKMVEDALIKDERFHLKGKHALLEPRGEGKYTIVDVAESPIERPKKRDAKISKSTTIQAKRNATRSKRNSS